MFICLARKNIVRVIKEPVNNRKGRCDTLPVFCTYSSTNRQPQSSRVCQKIPYNYYRSSILITKSQNLSFCFDLFYLLNKTCFGEASSLKLEGSSSRGGDVAVYVKRINQPSLPTPLYSVLVSLFLS